MTFLVFHLEISGNDFREQQLQNAQFKSETLCVFHFEISGKDNNDQQYIKIHHKFLTS